MIPNITNINDDPIFSVTGNLAMNWWYANNGVRIALDGGYLSAESANDDNTHGLGNHARADCKTGIEPEDGSTYRLEISNIQNCPRLSCGAKNRKVQGRDHGSGFKSGPVYGGYAIYVSKSRVRFPTSQTLALLIKSKTYVLPRRHSTGRKLNVHKTFNSRPESTGLFIYQKISNTPSNTHIQS